MAEQVKTWTSWQATVELRWLSSPTPGELPTLQQRWQCTGSDDPDKIGDEEWRDVPTEDFGGVKRWP